MEPWIDGLWDAMRKLISVSAVPKDAARNGLSSEVDDSTLDVLDTVVPKERNVDAKVPTTKSRDTSLPPLTATTSSPQIGRRKNAGEDVVPTKLASLPTNKSVTSSNTSSSSPLVSRTNPVTAVPTKPSPLSSPRLKHLELEHLSARVSAPSLGPPPTVLTPNQLWTGYRKGALKPIEGKSGDVADIDDQRRDENFLFGVPSKTFLAPLEGRARSISLIAADCTENNEGDLDVTQSSPNLPQYPPDALQAEHVPGEVLVSGIEEVVEGIGSASVKGDVNTAQDNTGDADIHTVLESGIPDETVNSTVPPDAEGAVSAVLERLRTLTCPLEQSLTTPSLQPSFLNVDLQVHRVGGGRRDWEVELGERGLALRAAQCVLLRSRQSVTPSMYVFCVFLLSGTCQLRCCFLSSAPRPRLPSILYLMSLTDPIQGILLHS